MKLSASMPCLAQAQAWPLPLPFAMANGPRDAVFHHFCHCQFDWRRGISYGVKTWFSLLKRFCGSLGFEKDFVDLLELAGMSALQ